MNRLILSICLVQFFLLNAAAEHRLTTDDLKARIEHFSSQYLQERVYMHFDNVSYMRGDKIWFKAYVVRGDNFSVTQNSRYLYVELVNSVGLPVTTQCLPVVDGQADGCIGLDSVKAGFYEVRAYTAWMLNFTPGDRHAWKKYNEKFYRRIYPTRFQHYLDGNAGIFSRVFPVYETNSDNETVIYTPPSYSVKGENIIDVKFFPEGGNLVEALPARVAFQVCDAYGRYLATDATVEIDGKPVVKTVAGQQGRGCFSLDKKYLSNKKKIVLKIKDREFPLPSVCKKGFTLGVRNNTDVEICRNNNTRGQILSLLVTCRQKVISASSVNLKDREYAKVVLDTASMPAGVNIITLINGTGKILAQREVFMDKINDRHYKIKTILSAESDSSKAFFSLTDDHNRPVKKKTAFSMSLMRKQCEDSTYYTDNILYNLLLSSEIKGFIPDIARYFNHDNPNRKEELDLLMMVQGWTRYDFDQMVGNKDFCVDVEPEKELSFMGELYSQNNEPRFDSWKLIKKPLWVYGNLLLDNDSIIERESRLTDGTFKLQFPDFYGNGTLKICVNDRSVIKTGEGGRLLRDHITISRQIPSCYINKAIVPRSVYSPMAKPWTYYETVVPDRIKKDTCTFKATFKSSRIETYIQNATGRLFDNGGAFVDFGVVAYNKALFSLLGIGGYSFYKDGDNDRLHSFLLKGLDGLVDYSARPSGLLCREIDIVIPRLYGRNMHQKALYYENVNGLDERRGHDREDEKMKMESYINYKYYDSDYNYRDFPVKYSWLVNPVKKFNYFIFKTDIQGLARPADFYHEDNAGRAMPATGQSYQTVYWNPAVKTDENGTAAIKIKGAFDVQDIKFSAEGITDDGLFMTCE